MGQITVTTPRLRKIAGRYFWRPTRAVKALGFVAEALGSDTAKAIERAQLLNDQVEAERRGVETPRPAAGTMADLIRIYRTDEAFTTLRTRTRKGYEKILREIEKVAGHLKGAEITRKGLKKTYRALKPRGLHIAAAHIRIWSILMGVAIDEDLRKDNPAKKLKLVTPPARTRRPTLAEVQAFCAKAEEGGRRSLKLAVLLAFELAQRQGDVIALPWTAWDGLRVRVSQSKTGEKVAPRATPLLKAALDEAFEGRQHATIVVSEATGLPYREDYFRHEFRRIANLAGLDFQFRDLRRGALSEAGDAGATLLELRSVGGHRTLAGAQPYLVPSTEQADAAIAKREAVRERNKEPK